MPKRTVENPQIESLEEKGEKSLGGNRINWKSFTIHTPFHQKYCQAIINFFNVELGAWVDAGIAGKRFVPSTLPHFTKFAREIGVTEKTLFEWAEIFPEFKLAMQMASDMRNEVLKDNSLLGNYDTQVAKLFLSHYAGIKEKQEVVPQIPMLPAGFIQGFNHFLTQRGEKPVLLPNVEEAEFTEEPSAEAVVSEKGKDFKKFLEDRKEN